MLKIATVDEHTLELEACKFKDAVAIQHSIEDCAELSTLPLRLSKQDLEDYLLFKSEVRLAAVLRTAAYLCDEVVLAQMTVLGVSSPIIDTDLNRLQSLKTLRPMSWSIPVSELLEEAGAPTIRDGTVKWKLLHDYMYCPTTKSIVVTDGTCCWDVSLARGKAEKLKLGEKLEIKFRAVPWTQRVTKLDYYNRETRTFCMDRSTGRLSKFFWFDEYGHGTRSTATGWQVLPPKPESLQGPGDGSAKTTVTGETIWAAKTSQGYQSWIYGADGTLIKQVDGRVFYYDSSKSLITYVETETAFTNSGSHVTRTRFCLKTDWLGGSKPLLVFELREETCYQSISTCQRLEDRYFFSVSADSRSVIVYDYGNLVEYNELPQSAGSDSS